MIAQLHFCDSICNKTPFIIICKGACKNDFFTLYGGPGLQLIQKLQVYSRWGSLVFEANNILPNDPKLGWDGKFLNQEVDPGVFVFRAEVVFADGVSELISGDITVLR